jgi:hypothetical protein
MILRSDNPNLDIENEFKSDAARISSTTVHSKQASMNQTRFSVAFVFFVFAISGTMEDKLNSAGLKQKRLSLTRSHKC